eukprot:09111_6
MHFEVRNNQRSRTQRMRNNRDVHIINIFSKLGFFLSTDFSDKCWDIHQSILVYLKFQYSRSVIFRFTRQAPAPLYVSQRKKSRKLFKSNSTIYSNLLIFITRDKSNIVPQTEDSQDTRRNLCRMHYMQDHTRLS